MGISQGRVSDVDSQTTSGEHETKKIPTGEVGGATPKRGGANPKVERIVRKGRRENRQLGGATPKEAGGFTPNLGGATPKEAGGFTPNLGGATPKEAGGFTPKLGGATPKEAGGFTPNLGGATLKFGGDTPNFGGATPKLGGATPKFGGLTPKFGGVTPKFGGATPKFGGVTPTAKECSIRLPVLSPISSTVQLVSSRTNQRMEANKAMDASSALKSIKTSVITHTHMQTEKLTRPVYLDDIIIGYETVSPTKILPETTTNEQIIKRKDNQIVNLNADLSPIIIPQDSVIITDDDGRKRKINFKDVEEIERDEERRKRRKKNIYEDIGPEIKKNKTLNNCEENAYLENQFKKLGEIETLPITDKEEITIDIPLSRDNPFLLNDKDAKSERLSPVAPGERQDEESVLTLATEVDAIPAVVELPGDDSSLPYHSCLEENDANLLLNANDHQEIPPSKDFCNICGKGVKDRKEATTFLELNTKSKKKFLCLTCHEKLLVSELTRHKAGCYLSPDEFYYPGCEDDQSFVGGGGKKTRGIAGRNSKKEVKFRMVACTNCVELMQTL